MRTVGPERASESLFVLSLTLAYHPSPGSPALSSTSDPPLLPSTPQIPDPDHWHPGSGHPVCLLLSPSPQTPFLESLITLSLTSPRPFQHLLRPLVRLGSFFFTSMCCCSGSSCAQLRTQLTSPGLLCRKGADVGQEGTRRGGRRMGEPSCTMEGLAQVPRLSDVQVLLVA